MTARSTHSVVGVRTGGDPRNREHVERHVSVSSVVERDLVAIGFDPQTSGGLLAAVDPAAAHELADAGFVTIGVVAAGAPQIVLG